MIGTGATAIQVIAEIADKVGHPTVFQRRPNWAALLNNSKISEAEMADPAALRRDLRHLARTTWNAQDLRVRLARVCHFVRLCRRPTSEGAEPQRTSD